MTVDGLFGHCQSDLIKANSESQTQTTYFVIQFGGLCVFCSFNERLKISASISDSVTCLWWEDLFYESITINGFQPDSLLWVQFIRRISVAIILYFHCSACMDFKREKINLAAGQLQFITVNQLRNHRENKTNIHHVSH